MALDRLNGFSSGVNAYDIPSVADNKQINPAKEELVKKQDEKEASPEKSGAELDLTVEVPRGHASIENVAISFGQYDESSLDLYTDMGLASTDMKQAISGMRKDEILHEYQYFVGKDMTGKESKIIADTEDGIVVKL